MWRSKCSANLAQASWAFSPKPQARSADIEFADRHSRRAEGYLSIQYAIAQDAAHGDAGALMRARRPIERRGPGCPGDGRCEPDQMAPRAHHLVLRGLRAEALPAPLPRVRSALRILLQLLLRERRPAPSAAEARPSHAPVGRRGARLPRLRR